MANVKKRAAGLTPPKKPTGKTRKDLMLRIRVNQEQKDLFEKTAAHDGLTLSSWLVSLALREARKAEGGSGS